MDVDAEMEKFGQLPNKAAMLTKLKTINGNIILHKNKIRISGTVDQLKEDIELI